ncbi:carbohydrate kinase [Micromonospora sp. NPDC049559]|uniref:carbohydrate kinase family protein n=1 Tax=Micromonospora sp. NPDC049559 TaxID=3155923 RepID=UPI003415D912
MSTGTITVVGEAVVDLVQSPDGRFTAHPGGSPLNVAVGLARLGLPTRLIARFSTNAFGRRLREHAEANGVDLGHAVTAAEPATLAVVSLAADGAAAYDFYLAGTADWQWRPAELAGALDHGGILHTGSLAAFLDPGAEHIAETLRAARDRGMVISLDPNVRPGLIGTPEQARARVERLVRHAHVVRASDEDVAWLYPGEPVGDVLQRWRDLGAALAIVTLGPDGAVAATGAGPLRQPAPVVEVVDTIGAGDAFTAGLLAALSRSGPGPSWHRDDIAAAMRFAVEVAALTCTRAGADPPRQDQLPDRSR